MDVYRTEEEQAEQIKGWVKNYGPSIIIGIVLALAINYGWKYWKNYRTQQAEQASAIYTRIISEVTAQKFDLVQKDTATLTKDYPKSPYTQFAQMLLTKQAITDKDYSKAISSLQWVSTHSKDQDLIIISQLRIARIQIQEDQAQAALDTLSKINNKSYTGLINIIKGDAYNQLGKFEQAKQAYQQALSQIPNIDQIAPMLRIKESNV